MGMYTSLYFCAPVNETGLVVARMLGDGESWENIAHALNTTERWREFWEASRALFIPHGSGGPDRIDGKELVRGVNTDAKTWSVSCALKDYGGEIDLFLELVLPDLIREETAVWTYYEEHYDPRSRTVLPSHEMR